MSITFRRYKTLLNKCEQCDSSFHPFLGRRKQRFCSDKCYRLFMTPKFIEKLCPVCGKIFSVAESHASRYTVCSLKCRHSKVIYKNCERCSKLFWAEPKLNRHYCSEACRRPPKTTNCLTCGKSFRYVPSADRRFCHRSCFRKYRGETRLEQTIRESLERLELKFLAQFQIGKFRADFVLIDQRIIIEADSIYFHDSVKDSRRDSLLKSYGWSVVRIKDYEVKNAINVDELIKNRINNV